MSKKLLLGVVAGVGTLVATSVFQNKESLSADERKKVEEAKQYLEEKGYVVVSKSKYATSKLNLFSISSLPIYYKAAKTVAKFVL